MERLISPISRSDYGYLVQEISEQVYRLKVVVGKHPRTRESFSNMKKELAFSWDDFKAIEISPPLGK
ncbi:hypothetical protein ANO14919_106110 [Xylariales sp. No.14919]|nr:hypothetical protein ANO14919_106110 [Xylariales sp. No.14919]